QTEGKIHQAQGKAMQVAGEVFDTPDLEAEGKVENFKGKSQEKVGDVKKTFNKE
ncbi:MAG: CsbD family protein, partial [Thermodesulfobacteriota bacterium]